MFNTGQSVSAQQEKLVSARNFPGTGDKHRTHSKQSGLRRFVTKLTSDNRVMSAVFYETLTNALKQTIPAHLKLQAHLYPYRNRVQC